MIAYCVNIHQTHLESQLCAFKTVLLELFWKIFNFCFWIIQVMSSFAKEKKNIKWKWPWYESRLQSQPSRGCTGESRAHGCSLDHTPVAQNSSVTHFFLSQTGDLTLCGTKLPSCFCTRGSLNNYLSIHSLEYSDFSTVIDSRNLIHES